MDRIHVLGLLKEASELIACVEESQIPNISLGKPVFITTKEKRNLRA